MPSTYPAALDAFTTTHADNVNEIIHAPTVNELADAVNKIEAELGLNPRGSYIDVATRLLSDSGGGNYITNPAFNDDTTGYTGADTLALSAPGVGLYGTYCAKVTKTGSAGAVTITTPRVTVAPTQFYSASLSCRIGSSSISTARTATMSVKFYDAVGTLLQTTTGSGVSLSLQNVWARMRLTALFAPDTAASAEITVSVSTANAAEYYYFDGFQLEPGTTTSSFNANIPTSALTGLMMAPGSIGIREVAVGSAKAFFGTAASIGTATGMVDGSLYITTDSPISAYFYYSGSWHLIAASQNTVNNPGMYDFPFTVDPRLQQGNNMTMTANNIYYSRVQGQAEINGIGYFVGTADSSNTLTFGVYDTTGTGRGAVPNNLKATVTTGVQSGTGYKTQNFSSPVTVNHGDWFAWSTASTTLALQRAAATATNSMSLGLALAQTGGGPTMPNPPTATLFGDQRGVILIGV